MENTSHPMSFDALRRQHGDASSPSVKMSLPDALAEGDDPFNVISYLRGLGVEVRSLADLEAGIAGLDGEEELSAFRCREGVAVSVASDGLWLLLTDAADHEKA